METTNAPANSECPYCPPAAPSLSNSPTPKLSNSPSPTPPPKRPYPALLTDLDDTDSIRTDLAATLPDLLPPQRLSTHHSPLLTSYLPPAQLTLLVAHPSTGKSQLTLHLAASLSRNQNPFTPERKSPDLPPANQPPLASTCHVAPPSDSRLNDSRFNDPAPLSNSLTPKLSNSSPEILILSENPLSHSIPRLQALGADLTKIHFLPRLHSLVSLDKPTKSNPDPLRPLTILQNFLDNHPNVRLIILDPLLKYLNHYANRLDLTRATAPATLLEKLMAIAADRNITLLATATLPHLNCADLPTSLAKHPFTTQIKNILLLAPDPRPNNLHLHPHLNLHQTPSPNPSHSPTLSPSPSLLLMSLKSQQNPPPTLPLNLIHGIPTFHPHPNSRFNDSRLNDSRFNDSPSFSNSLTPEISNYSDWYSQSLSLTPSDLPSLTRQHRPASPAIAEAMAFLHSYLEDSGPISFKKIAKDLAPNALAESTVREASRLMGIIKTPNLFQKNWVWHLKDDLRPFPGDPKTNPALQQAKDRAKEQAFFAHQEKRRLAFAAQMMERESPDSPSSPVQSKIENQKSKIPTPQVQQNKPSQPTPAPKSTTQPPQPPRPPIPLGPITT